MKFSFIELLFFKDFLCFYLVILGSYIWVLPKQARASQVVLVVKNPPTNAGDIRDLSSVLGSGRSPGGGHGNPFQYSCLDTPVDRGAWQATVCGVAELDMTEAT